MQNNSKPMHMQNGPFAYANQIRRKITSTEYVAPREELLWISVDKPKNEA